MVKRFSGLLPALILAASASGQIAAYQTAMELEEPIEAGDDVTITGSGAPAGPGIWVELWRIPAGSRVAKSVASVATDGTGAFTFTGVSAADGDRFYATLSRSWHFETDGDAEGWDQNVNDCTLQVVDGALQVEIEDIHGPTGPDGWRDPFFHNWFDGAGYDPQYYRVVEVRLRSDAPPNPAAPPEFLYNWFGLYWGAPWGFDPVSNVLAQHGALFSAETRDFQTILMPMGKDETDIVPGNYVPGDDLWVTVGRLNDTLRIDVIEAWPQNDAGVDGAIVEIDYIRIREDLRWDFNNGDTEAIDGVSDIENLKVADGFLTYDVADTTGDQWADPYFWRRFDAGHLPTEYFTHLVLGYENPQVTVPEGDVALFFDDADSVGYWDDGGPVGQTTLQRAAGLLPYAGRVDAFVALDEVANPVGEWSEDNKVRIAALRIDLPEAATAGDRIAIDYYGFVPAEPYGPSPLVTVGSAPVAFKRGDANRDGGMNVADAVYILQNLFAKGPPILCRDAADSNDDEGLNVADAVYILQNLFAKGPAIPAPGPNSCGPDLTPNPDPTKPDLPPCDYCPAACQDPPGPCPAAQ